MFFSRRFLLPSAFLALLGASTPAYAQLDAATTRRFCSTLAVVASAIPLARDQGTPLSTTVLTIRHELQEQMDPYQAGKVDTFLTQIAVQAYAQPQLTVDATQRLVHVLCTVEFATGVILGRR